MRLWPALAQQNGIDTAHVKFHKISAAVREPILSAGQVDAVAGFSYLSAVNLRDRGVPGGDLVALRYADYGCEAYGFAVVVNPAFAAAKPDTVKGFVRALIAGINATVKDPARAADEAASRIDGGDRDLELERLRTVLVDNILTDEGPSQRPRRHRPGAHGSRDRPDRAGFQIPQPAGGGRHLRQRVLAASCRAVDQLSKTDSFRYISRAIPD
ncbi:ABC-type nitrate/sulfonate/bicarbonate transport system substrate-binding protein [Bradyrhizobium sp. GM22.5]